MRLFARKPKDADALGRPGPPAPQGTAAAHVLELRRVRDLVRFAPMSQALKDDATTTHRRLFTAGTPKAQQKQFRARLVEIVRAQHQLLTGTYGTCAGCGAPIEIERLTAEPTATRCSPCVAMPLTGR